MVTQQTAIQFFCPLSDLDPDLVTKSTILKGFIYTFYWPWQPMYGKGLDSTAKPLPQMCYLQQYGVPGEWKSG